MRASSPARADSRITGSVRVRVVGADGGEQAEAVEAGIITSVSTRSGRLRADRARAPPARPRPPRPRSCARAAAARSRACRRCRRRRARGPARRAGATAPDRRRRSVAGVRALVVGGSQRSASSTNGVAPTPGRAQARARAPIRSGGRCALPVRNAHGERRAVALAALDRDLAAVQLHQLLHQREADAGAFVRARARVAARDGSARTRCGSSRFRDADAGVADGELDARRRRTAARP